MIENLDFLVHFWELRARFEQLGLPLTEAERLELLSLMPMIGSTGLGTDEESAFETEGLPIQLTAGCGFLCGHLRELLATGIVVSAAEAIEPGLRTIAHVADAITGVEYSLPCRVAWARDESPWLMGLELDGLPRRAQFTSALSASRSPFGTASPRPQAS